MIKIDKGEAPAFLTDPEKKWCKETQKAIDHYEKHNSNKAFSFKAYNDRELKKILFNRFHKCAYCEGAFGATSDGDVEHFRPKGRVAGKEPLTPGYYWLANDWDNLLLSCQHCNQGRVHDLAENDQIDLNGGKVAKRGKEDKFPMRQDCHWSTRTGVPPEEEEYRLLINPCTDDPDIHFDYDQDTALMIAKTEMGFKSIEVYALTRKKLVDHRCADLISFFTQLDMLKMTLENYARDNTERNSEFVKCQLNIMKTLTSKESQYAGMKRFFFKKFLKANDLII